MNSVALRVSPATSQTSTMFLGVQDGGFAVRQGHLAPPVNQPDSPRPQKATTAEPLASTTLTVPTEKGSATTTKSGPTTRAASKSPNRVPKKK